MSSRDDPRSSQQGRHQLMYTVFQEQQHHGGLAADVLQDEQQGLLKGFAAGIHK